MNRMKPCLSDGGQSDVLDVVLDAHPARGPVYRNRARVEVVSIHRGLDWVTVRCLSVGGEVPVCVRWRNQMNVEPGVRVGDQLDVSIRSDAVLLGARDIWPGLPRWNRWRGRIVLARPQEESCAITVKLLGASWTLMSTNRVEGCGRPPRAWDEVNIVIDPAAIRLRKAREDFDTGKWVSVAAIQAMSPPRVSMKGQLSLLRQTPSGYLISMEIGSAMVSAVMDAGPDSLEGWRPGMLLDVSMSGSDAWVRPSGTQTALIKCALVYSDGTASEREEVLAKQ